MAPAHPGPTQAVRGLLVAAAGLCQPSPAHVFGKRAGSRIYLQISCKHPSVAVCVQIVLSCFPILACLFVFVLSLHTMQRVCSGRLLQHLLRPVGYAISRFWRPSIGLRDSNWMGMLCKRFFSVWLYLGACLLGP